MRTLDVTPVEVPRCGTAPPGPTLAAWDAPVPGGDQADIRRFPIAIKVASTRDERAAAFRLVYRRYLESGLCAPNPSEMRVTPYQLLPTTTIFVAVYQGEVIFTLSLVGDGELGVPMESIFPDEVRGLRAHGVTFGEVSCLADRRRELSRFLPLFVRVCRLTFQFARRHGSRRLLIAVHPKHGRFYERFFGFRPLGGTREYQSVLNKPAAAYSLDFSWFTKDLYDQYFGEEIPPEELEPHPMAEGERAHFSRFTPSSAETGQPYCEVL